MFYTYILRSHSQPEQRYIGRTADLKSRLAIRRFFCLGKNKRSATERAKDALHSSQSDGGLKATYDQKCREFVKIKSRNYRLTSNELRLFVSLSRDDSNKVYFRKIPHFLSKISLPSPFVLRRGKLSRYPVS